MEALTPFEEIRYYRLQKSRIYNDDMLASNYCMRMFFLLMEIDFVLCIIEKTV